MKHLIALIITIIPMTHNQAVSDQAENLAMCIQWVSDVSDQDTREEQFTDCIEDQYE